MIGLRILCIITAASSFLLSLSLYRHVSRNEEISTILPQIEDLKSKSLDLTKYSFEGMDYPNFMPISSITSVHMQIEESVHYAPSSSLSTKEWLYNSPWGSGTIRLGSHNRTFFLSMFHDMHCLRRIHSALTTFPSGTELWHLHHCFNTIRQSVLCHADMTLEKGDFAERFFEVERVGANHVCRNWEEVYDILGLDWFRWRRYIKTTNLTGWQQYSNFF
ncbi:hypothetical protein K435DRAFT_140683 [Dendrothele bispora CBS 962.96]|uniref:Uncharacterized protein n=1 Tax=Dendrothele bispora (strain CBS 962.96) TaxID=1314807 RepID=A0A4S8LZA3_DENBC|nr:hypothetical protein K435DRAFT_140683 [Dendrothele bispora CBS 962.96]